MIVPASALARIGAVAALVAALAVASPALDARANDSSVSVTVGPAAPAGLSVDFGSMSRIGQTSRYRITAQAAGVGTITLAVDGVTITSQALAGGSATQTYTFEMDLPAGEHVIDFVVTDGASTVTKSTTVRAGDLDGSAPTVAPSVLLIAQPPSSVRRGGETASPPSTAAPSPEPTPTSSARASTSAGSSGSNGSDDVASPPDSESEPADGQGALETVSKLVLGLVRSLGGPAPTSVLLASIAAGLWWLLLARRRRRKEKEAECADSGR